MVIHPHVALCESSQSRRHSHIPVCEHYAGSERFIRKAFELQQHSALRFDITCDCEDGAPLGAEREHLQTILALIEKHTAPNLRAGIRVHPIHHPVFTDDIEAIFQHPTSQKLAYLTVPKVDSAAELIRAIDQIKSTASRHKREIPPLHVVIETQPAVRDVWNIASIPEIKVLAFGLWDFIADHGGAIPSEAMQSPGQFEHELVRRAKCEIVAAALAHGKCPAHNPTLNLNSPQSVHDDALRARNQFGFLRFWSIHPTQIDSICRALLPSDALLTMATELLLAAQKANWGPIRFNDKLYDRASYRIFWNALQQAAAHNLPLPEAAAAAFFQSRDTAP